jgi:hypothetical protein
MVQLQQPNKTTKLNILYRMYTLRKTVVHYLYFDVYIDILSHTNYSPKWKVMIISYMIMTLVGSTSRVNSDATTEYFSKSFWSLMKGFGALKNKTKFLPDFVKLSRSPDLRHTSFLFHFHCSTDSFWQIFFHVKCHNDRKARGKHLFFFFFALIKKELEEVFRKSNGFILNFMKFSPGVNSQREKPPKNFPHLPFLYTNFLLQKNTLITRPTPV